MNRRQFLATTGVASIATLAGCGVMGGDSGTPTVSQSDIGAEVTMTEGNTFDPIRVSVEEGEAVQWTNETGDERTIRSNANADFSSEWGSEMEATLADGETYAHTFEGSGIYTYHDTNRTWSLMCGAVAVGDQSEDDIDELECERFM